MTDDFTTNNEEMFVGVAQEIIQSVQRKSQNTK